MTQRDNGQRQIDVAELVALAPGVENGTGNAVRDCICPKTTVPIHERQKLAPISTVPFASGFIPFPNVGNVAVDRARHVGQAVPMFQRKARAGANLHLGPWRNFDLRAGGYDSAGHRHEAHQSPSSYKAADQARGRPDLPTWNCDTGKVLPTLSCNQTAFSQAHWRFSRPAVARPRTSPSGAMSRRRHP